MPYVPLTPRNRPKCYLALAEIAFGQPPTTAYQHAGWSTKCKPGRPQNLFFGKPTQLIWALSAPWPANQPNTCPLFPSAPNRFTGRLVCILKEKTHLDTFGPLACKPSQHPQMLFSSAQNKFWGLPLKVSAPWPAKFWGCPGLHSRGKTILPKCYFPMQAKGWKVSK